MNSNCSLTRCEFPILFAHFLKFDARSEKILCAALHIIRKAARIISRQKGVLSFAAVEFRDAVDRDTPQGRWREFRRRGGRRESRPAGGDFPGFSLKPGFASSLDRSGATGPAAPARQQQIASETAALWPFHDCNVIEMSPPYHA
ncbi:MAG TPA: hypothetical protein VK143_02450 [Burkholderiales bacterium]|nr:hypothetical protein [Burkholderiales bacterium]